jgi:nucleotide-binding universal stress UspA family protein
VQHKVSHIIAATDLSEASASSSQWAAWLAQRFGARVTFLHALEAEWWALPEALSDSAASARALRDAAERWAREELGRWSQRFGGGEVAVREGPARQVIPQACTELGADLVCVGTHGRTGLARVFFGSVAEHVVRTSPVPVLTVRPHRPPQVRRILAATDFSVPAQEAVAWARTLAQACQAEVVLLHVVELDPETFATVPREIMEPAVGAQIRDYLVDRATRRLRSVAGEGEGVEVRLGFPGSGLVQAAEELGVDLVCMGTRGQTGLAHVLLGSVAEYVLRRASAPVLTCRAPR